MNRPKYIVRRAVKPFWGFGYPGVVPNFDEFGVTNFQLRSAALFARKIQIEATSKWTPQNGHRPAPGFFSGGSSLGPARQVFVRFSSAQLMDELRWRIREGWLMRPDRFADQVENFAARQ